MRVENHDSDDGSVIVTLHFGRDELTTTETPFGVVVKLVDIKSGGEPGAPALPRTQLRLAVPEPLWPGSLKIIDEKWERALDVATLVVPAQRPRPAGVNTAYHCAPDCTCRTAHRPDRSPVSEGFPAPPFAPPNAGAYEAAIKSPPPVVRTVRIETIGTTRIAVIEVAPVRIAPKSELELCTSVRLAVETVKEPWRTDQDQAIADFKKLYGKNFDVSRVIPQPERFISGLTEATWLRNNAISQVLNPRIVGRLRPEWPVIEQSSDYLIITDDVTWDAETITPLLVRPGLITAFDRLAQAKRARGISARVVSITDIVGGRWGDVRTGSRDLQEVIRRFLKLVRQQWGVNWLLLGGDTSIVPVRKVAGACTGGVGPPSDTNPPPERGSFWTGSHMNIHTIGVGKWYYSDIMNTLVRLDTGQIIPYDSAGTSSSTSPGWYFTTSDNYATRSATATDFVRVEGPASLVNGGTLQFLYYWNILPTDFYYASLSSWVSRKLPIISPLGFSRYTVDYVYTPEHDWDAVGNSLYGQFHDDGTDIDGVILQTEISVGRAPVESAEEATTFVDKTLAYERLGNLRWLPANANWPRKMLLASADWVFRTFLFRTSNAIPANLEYHYDATSSQSILKIDSNPDSFDFNVIARITEDDRRILPFKSDPSSTGRGWYFATSATDMTPSSLPIAIGLRQIRIPFPSAWVVVHGSLEECTPPAFEFDFTGPDGSMRDQERLRKQIIAELPGIDRYDRYYEDEFDLSLAERVAAPYDFLSESNLRSGLNAAPHLVSLSGHGTSDGCCALSASIAASLTNGSPGFIAYADSCLTNQFDIDDAMGEVLLKNPNGGAVAYIGNTRFSWIDVGDDFQRAFFHRLTATRHLGLLNDSRTTVFGTTGAWAGMDRWQIYTLNLLGDPELQVYRGALRQFILPQTPVRLKEPFIRVLEGRQRPVGPPTPNDPGPVEGALVHVRQGERAFAGRTDVEGFVRLPEGVFEKGQLEVTVSHDDHAVVTEVVPVE